MKKQRGITLLELLIGMTLSLLLIGGAFSVYLSNKQTSEARQQLDNRQEALRFASYTINRIVKNGAAIDEDSTASELVVAFNRSSGSPDCLGNTEVSDAVDRFRFDDKAKTLTCNGQLLLSGIDQLSFSYLSSDNVGRLGVVPAADATLVKVNVAMGALQTSFAATSRSSLIKTELAEEIVVNLPDTTEQSSPIPGSSGEDEGASAPGTGPVSPSPGANQSGQPEGALPPNTGSPAGNGNCECSYHQNKGFILDTKKSVSACTTACCSKNMSNPKHNDRKTLAAALCI